MHLEQMWSNGGDEPMNRTDQVNEIGQLLREIDAIYTQPLHKLVNSAGIDEENEIYQTAFLNIWNAWDQLHQDLRQRFGADKRKAFSEEAREIIPSLKAEKAWPAAERNPRPALGRVRRHRIEGDALGLGGIRR
jgi:hypothetical protein